MEVEVRERALIQELWCAVKHLLCAEEHLLESCQKIVRDARVEKKDELWKLSIELLEICDVVRSLRQKIVEATLEAERKCLLTGEK